MFDEEFEKEFVKGIEGLIETIGRDLEKEIVDGKIKCIHEFIPIFNTICCKYCGVDKDKI